MMTIIMLILKLFAKFLGHNKPMQKIKLRTTIQSDFNIFFQNQQDKEANHMAAFTAKDPSDKKNYFEKWLPFLDDKTVTLKTILSETEIAGSICTYPMGDEIHITYWINKAFWGQGIATKALDLFLNEFTERPLHASTAFGNYGSMKVLERCSFVKTGETGTYFANGRGMEIEEVFFKLEV